MIPLELSLNIQKLCPISTFFKSRSKDAVQITRSVLANEQTDNQTYRHSIITG